jgi:two-component system, sensor histidine kinase SagS
MISLAPLSCGDRFLPNSRLLLQSEEVLDGMPDAVCLLDSSLIIHWTNRRFREGLKVNDPIGRSFYEALGNPQFFRSVCPFDKLQRDPNHAEVGDNCTLQFGDGRFFNVHVALLKSENHAVFFVATLSDVSSEIQQQQKLAAIHQAGSKLTDLKPEEIFAMDVEQRIELLKDNIQHYTRDLLNVDVIEIRLLEQSTGQLIPLLSVGIDKSAVDRRLLARTQANGVTGWVAAQGKSYLCEDTSKDPLYIEGFKGAKSSLTVPILLHEQVIGTINVESPKIRAFNGSDQQFLEIFARDVAVALNTLELLVAQKTNAAQQSCGAIHSAVAIPIDDILIDAVRLTEGCAGLDPELIKRIERILQNARDIKRSIHRIGQSVAPIETISNGMDWQKQQKLNGKRILVVDSGFDIRSDAHALLEPYGCIVETAREGDEAVLMVRNCGANETYDIVISDIRLPDYSGYQLMLRLQQFMEHVPMVLMTGFGYDPGHSIVKARQAGLHPKALLYKPFRIEQLLSVAETILDNYQATTTS